MKKIFLFTTTIFLFAVIGNAQKVNGIVKGILQDSTSASPLADATISVIRAEDSSLISFTLTSNSGYFEIKNLDAGNYKIIASFTGLQTLKKAFSVTASNPVADLGAVKLDRIYNTLDEVVVSDDAPIRIKGDTLSFKADAFATKPNATVEDLLKKIPGMTVERDGTVKAQGENVQKVYVDGKEFFNNDPKMATKNLTADMVDRVEVFDDMSEQAKFNGVDDGSRSKSINLKLKKDKKKGLFGKAYAGYGTEERYDAGVTANFFKGATQTSVIAKSNNTNNMGFTVSDMLGMMGGGSGGMGGGMGAMMMGGGGGMNARGGGGMMGAMMMGGGMSGGNFGSGSNGITSSSQVGINYRDTWSKYFDMNGSVFYNNSNTNNDRRSFRQTFTADSSLNADRQTLSRNSNSNYRMNFNLIYSIDSFNSIIYSPNVNFQNSNTFSDDSLSSIVSKKASQYKINENRTINANEGSGYNWSNNLIWRKRFRTPGRTLSVNINNTLSNNKRDGFTTIQSRFFNNDGVERFNRLNEYQVHSENEINNYTAGMSYTEPIARDKILEFNYSHSDNRSGTNRTTLNKNPFTGNYDMQVDSLSNQFENVNTFDRIGSNIRIVKKKYNYQLGFAVQQLSLNSNNISKQNNLSQKYTNFFPSASFNYQFARSRNLRFNYRGRTNQPTVSQLQDVTDIINYPYITRGNPSLRQEFINNFSLNYSYFDIVSLRNIFAFVTYNTTRNKISNSVDQLPGGIQQTTPINVNGVYNVSGNFNVGFPIRSLKGSNFNTTTRIAYNQDANLINKQMNYSKNLTLGEDLRFSYNYKEKLDLGVTAGVNYNSVNYTIQSGNNDSYFTHNYSADVTYTFPLGFILSTDFDYIFNTGRADGFNLNYAMWNASFAKQVFKNKRGEIKASVYDILNQNTSVNRNLGTNYIEDVQNSVLNRFFMLTFTYNINRMGGRTMPAVMERATRGIRIN